MATMDERGSRIGENEALFRRVNEQIEDVNDAFGHLTGDFSIVCECGEQTCVDQITIGVGVYEEIRAEPTRFFVRPGHVIPDVEHVVAREGDFWVVQKREGEPAELARRLDTRP
jgi:hypothetical protein